MSHEYGYLVPSDINFSITPYPLIGNSLDHETWHTCRATYSVQIFLTIFLPMSAVFDDVIKSEVTP